jgi:hypothetical protein
MLRFDCERWTPAVSQAARLHSGRGPRAHVRLIAPDPEMRMPGLFQALARQLDAARRRPRQPSVTRRYRCACGQPVFFRNSRCVACGRELGYAPERAAVIVVEADPSGDGRLREHDVPGGPAWRRCGNLESSSCNWLVAPAADGSFAPLCRACRLNRTIPDLSEPLNAALWLKVEMARRRLISQLIALGLPVEPRSAAPHGDPERGLVFDVLKSLPGAPPVMTGHGGGTITLNLDEADDAVREQTRAAMHEPYRTLLGHFRHEVGHYYWDRLIAGSELLDEFRRLFGDERADYAAALQRHYAEGPALDWAQRCVSGYASVHPWEDWAETWAHYLHMVDTLDTALSFGLDAADLDFDSAPFGRDALWRPDDPGGPAFLEFVNAWVEVTGVMNEMSRSMGQPDFYPFVLPKPVIGKLQFVQAVVAGAAG